MNTHLSHIFQYLFLLLYEVMRSSQTSCVLIRPIPPLSWPFRMLVTGLFYIFSPCCITCVSLLVLRQWVFILFPSVIVYFQRRASSQIHCCFRHANFPFCYLFSHRLPFQAVRPPSSIGGVPLTVPSLLTISVSSRKITSTMAF